MIAYRYKLYNHNRNRYLADMLCEASFVWNHALSLQQRYYKLFGKYISLGRMKKHFAKRIHRCRLHSQTTQEILERLDTAYSRFFDKVAKRPPKLKKAVRFTSFVFKQGGFRLDGNALTINAIHKTFRFFKSREWQGNVKQVRVKRGPAGSFLVVIVTDAEPTSCRKSHNGASVGVDFGLKTYLTFSDGSTQQNPQFLKKSLNDVKRAHRQFSRKQKGSAHRKAAWKTLAKAHAKVVNRREDFQWKLAHDLCRRYDVIFLEDLQLTGMARLWGRKVNDLAHGAFVLKLQYVAQKYGVTVHKIDRYFPSSRLCDCGWKNETLSLSDREWVCPQCGAVHDRDLHAAEMILRRGLYELESGSKTPLGFAKGAVHVCIQESHGL